MSAPQVVGDIEGLNAKLTSQQGCVYLLSFTGPLTMQQRNSKAKTHTDRADVVRDGHTSRLGAAVWIAGLAHYAAPSLAEDVHAAAIGIGPVWAIARSPAVNDARVDLTQRLVVAAEPGERGPAHVAHEDVCILDQTVHDLTAALIFEVNTDRALASVETMEVGVERRLRGDGSAPATKVRRIRTFDLDYIGTEIGQHRSRVCALLEDRHIQDAYAFEGKNHCDLLMPNSREGVACKR